MLLALDIATKYKEICDNKKLLPSQKQMMLCDNKKVFDKVAKHYEEWKSTRGQVEPLPDWNEFRDASGIGPWSGTGEDKRMWFWNLWKRDMSILNERVYGEYGLRQHQDPKGGPTWWEWMAARDGNRWFEKFENYDFDKDDWKITDEVLEIHRMNQIDNWSARHLVCADGAYYDKFFRMCYKDALGGEHELIEPGTEPPETTRDRLQELRQVVSMRRWLFTGNCSGTGSLRKVPQKTQWRTPRYLQFTKQEDDIEIEALKREIRATEDARALILCGEEQQLVRSMRRWLLFGNGHPKISSNATPRYETFLDEEIDEDVAVMALKDNQRKRKREKEAYWVAVSIENRKYRKLGLLTPLHHKLPV